MAEQCFCHGRDGESWKGHQIKLAGENPEPHYMLYFLLLLHPFSVYFKKIINKAPLLTCRNCKQLMNGVMEGTDFWTALIYQYSRPYIIKGRSYISTVTCFFEKEHAWILKQYFIILLFVKTTATWPSDFIVMEGTKSEPNFHVCKNSKNFGILW